MEVNAESRYMQAVSMMPPFEKKLMAVPGRIAENAIEIRVRAGRPLVVETPSERYVCAGIKAGIDEIYSCIKYFCDYSIYSYEKELSEGWITLRGGHRAGFTGTAVTKNGEMTAIRDISSLNVRIAREHRGIAEKLLSMTALENGLRGLLIIGRPLSAKTTMLRDYTRLLSAFAKVSVIDERGEIAAVYGGIPQNDVGLNTDVLNCFPRSEGIMQALRSLSPEYLVCDEIGAEYRQLADCSGKGAKLILTAHCGSIEEAQHNAAVRFLTESCAVNYIALLGSGADIGKVKGLWRVNDIEELCGCCGSNDLYGCRSRVLGDN